MFWKLVIWMVVMKNGKWKIIFGEIKNREAIEENRSMKSGSFPNLDEDICETGAVFCTIGYLTILFRKPFFAEI